MRTALVIAPMLIYLGGFVVMRRTFRRATSQLVEQCEHERITAEIGAWAFARLLLRCRPWLTCDHCDGQLDPREGIGTVGDQETQELLLLCSTCAERHEREHHHHAER